MILYRISNHSDLSGRGAELAHARWHTRAKDRRLVYLADHPALSVLERLAQTDPGVDFPANFNLLSVDVPDDLVQTLNTSQLPAEWREDQKITQRIGDEWLASRRSLALLVPTVLVPFARNCLLNPLVAGAAELAVNDHGRFPLDARIRVARNP